MRINFEFKNEVFYIRLFGALTKNNLETKNIKSILENSNVKYIVLNTKNIELIDLTGINYLFNIYDLSQEMNTNFAICDDASTIRNLFQKNIRFIKEENEIL